MFGLIVTAEAHLANAGDTAEVSGSLRHYPLQGPQAQLPAAHKLSFSLTENTRLTNAWE